MKRRTLLKQVGVGAVAVAAAPNVFAGTALADDKVGFTFVAPTKAVSGPFTGDVAILSGSGKFGGDDAEGRGRLTHFRPSTLAVIGTASWRARKLVSFVQSGTTLGAHAAGLATLEIVIRPDGSNDKVPATLKISCHLPGRPDPALPEGIDLTSPLGHFAGIGGTTAFTPEFED